jgi:hypothetical protein
MTTDNCFYLKNRYKPVKQEVKGNSDTFPFSIPWLSIFTVHNCRFFALHFVHANISLANQRHNFEPKFFVAGLVGATTLRRTTLKRIAL